jgi:catechol 2,3-dioxygenase-like lactoylglutathione lyase family enzyme
MKQTAFAFRVKDLPTSIHFYLNQPGFSLDDPEADIACIVDSDGDPLLLAGPRVDDPKRYLSPPQLVLPPGETLRFLDHNIEARCEALSQHGFGELQIVETPFGDRELRVRDPDGYGLTFIQLGRRTSEEVMALYRDLPDELESAVARLSEEDLNLARRGGGWSMRQIVHHLADSETLFLQQLRKTLIEPGSVYYPNYVNENSAVSGPVYTQRPIDSSLAYIRASHNHILGITDLVEGFWEYAIQIQAEGRSERQETFGATIKLLVRHAYEHLEEIRAIRAEHGR